MTDEDVERISSFIFKALTEAGCPGEFVMLFPADKEGRTCMISSQTKMGAFNIIKQFSMDPRAVSERDVTVTMPGVGKKVN